jgi:hypothetical protein
LPLPFHFSPVSSYHFSLCLHVLFWHMSSFYLMPLTSETGFLNFQHPQSGLPWQLQTNPNFSSVQINWCPFRLQANYFSPFGFSILYFVWSWPCYPQALLCLLVWNPGAVFKSISLALNFSRLSCLVFWYYSLYFLE